jgi:hypothetical protein
MMAVDDLESRMRYLESEMAGEKLVTREILQKTLRSRDEIAATRTDITRLDMKIDRMAADTSLINAAQLGQGQMLNILVQDVRAIRTRQDAMDAKLLTMDSKLLTMDSKLVTIDSKLVTIDSKLDVVLEVVRELASHAQPAI